ncbi:MAG: hypothetical protein HUJ51_04865 [Eggerthellaceae bacterium]|nr:hypothetical protein [Eggerthellaceae bacterium]
MRVSEKERVNSGKCIGYFERFDVYKEEAIGENVKPVKSVVAGATTVVSI